MVTVKIILRKEKQKKDGTYPLALRIIKDRKPKYIHTGKSIFLKDWNEQSSLVKKSHPNSVRLNNMLLKKLAEATNMALDAENFNNQVSSAEVKNKIKRTGKAVSFFDVAMERIETYLAKGTFSVANVEKAYLSNIKAFTKNKPLYFTEINQAFLSRFKSFCQAELNHKTRTVTNHLMYVRTVFNIAIKEGYVDVKHYPFGRDKEKIRLTSGLKIGLTREEVEKIEMLVLEKESQIWHTRNIWLFAFYLAGIRISDVIQLTWSDFKDGRLLYIMHKNEKPVSLKIPNKAEVILNHYKNRKQAKSKFIFPHMDKADLNNKKDVFTKTRNASKLFNEYLKQIADLCDIDKNLSNHIARHTFGNLAGDKIHPLMLQKLYRHSDLRTTINYQANFIHKEADEALDSVIDF